MPEPIIKTRSNGTAYQIEVLDSSTGLIRQTELAAGTSDPAKVFRPISVDIYNDDYVTTVPTGTDPASFMYAWLLRRRFSSSASVDVASLLAAQFPDTPELELELERAAAVDLYAANPI